MAVVLTNKQGEEKRYVKGVAVQHDGYGDLQILDAQGNMIATRKRTSYEEVEVTDD